MIFRYYLDNLDCHTIIDIKLKLVTIYDMHLNWRRNGFGLIIIYKFVIDASYRKAHATRVKARGVAI